MFKEKNKIKQIIYQVDAFTDELFRGNPAAVCIMEEWIPDEKMQLIAMENNLAETAFIVKEGVNYHIRWFTPTLEVDLCGHATIASAYVIFNTIELQDSTISFISKSGILVVNKEISGLLTLDFPSDQPKVVTDFPSILFEGLQLSPRTVWRGKFDYMVEVESEEIVNQLQPIFSLLNNLNSRGIIVTSKGDKVDFVSRCFFPQSGIDEDPVTGSAHCLLVPYWNSKTNKTEFSATQNSARKGHLFCRLAGDRVLMSGSAVLYLKGEIYI